jgi:biotin carboxyl carrier protein
VVYEVEVNGRIRRVSLEWARAGGPFAVSIDGRTRQVDAARTAGNEAARTLSLIIEPGSAYDVGVSRDAVTGGLAVRVGGVQCAVALSTGRRRRQADERGSAATGPQRIVAPMPGKIVRVAVTAGEAVRARQTIVVIEAMKMENELRAGRDGTVGELRARSGAPVEAGELLAVIE